MTTRIRHRFQNISNRDVLLILSGISLGTSLASAFGEAASGAPNWPEWMVGFFQNFSTEMFGGFITFLLIEVLIVSRKDRERVDREFNEKIEEKQRRVAEERQNLLLRISSRVNGEAMRAAEELRARTWLDDGLLNGANLGGANLQDVHLAGAMLIGTQFHRANMQGCSLYRANLENAQLVGADLFDARLRGAILKGASMQGANLEESTATHSQLCRAARLKGATMPDGTRYDGRYQLRGDLADAEGRGTDLDSPESLAAYYKVPLETYLEGQTWADQHLARLTGDAALAQEEDWK
jgi:uncharacterized protein YjbI with pentapeptide repeats